MSDIFSDISGMSAAKGRACSVAYTINNTQPVLCSIIGDQPLFYMDYDIDYEDSDAELLDAADMQVLEHELLSLQNEIDSFDNFSSDFVRTPESEFEELLNDKGNISSTEDKAVTTDKSQLLEALSKSRMAKAYIDFANEHGVEIKLSAQISDAHYDRESLLIFVNPNLDFTDQILLTARELRRHWQHRQGALINPLMFHPDNAVLVNRAQVADLTVAMIRIAWELQLSGEKQAWERIENSPMADLGHAFAREAFLDFRTLNNGHAATAVFECWFLSERCRNEDKKMIQQMLADYQGYVFDIDEAREAITPALIAALGTMPYGKNYLTQHTATIMSDPIFTDIRDRSNANFLWFIKFERSFRETEQELQMTTDLSTGGASSSDTNVKDQDYKHGAQSTADIISLFPESGDADEQESNKSSKILSPKSNKRGKKGRSADVIYLRRWSGE